MFAVKPIRRRVHIAAYRGPLLTDEEAKRREARDARYLFTLNSKWTIDGSPRWNLARYINHSCRPNAEPVTRNGGIVIVAMRRIAPEEEITYDYGPDYRSYFFKGRSRCLCPPCRARRKKKAKVKRQSSRNARRKALNKTVKKPTTKSKPAKRKPAKRKSR